MEKQYKLLKKYPSLPEDWEVGMTVGLGDYPSLGYAPTNGEYTNKRIKNNQVQNNPEFWEKVVKKSVTIQKALKEGYVVGNKILCYDCKNDELTLAGDLEIDSQGFIYSKVYELARIYNPLNDEWLYKMCDIIINNKTDGPKIISYTDGYNTYNKYTNGWGMIRDKVCCEQELIDGNCKIKTVKYDNCIFTLGDFVKINNVCNKTKIVSFEKSKAGKIFVTTEWSGIGFSINQIQELTEDDEPIYSLNDIRKYFKTYYKQNIPDAEFGNFIDNIKK